MNNNNDDSSDETKIISEIPLTDTSATSTNNQNLPNPPSNDNSPKKTKISTLLIKLIIPTIISLISFVIILQIAKIETIKPCSGINCLGNAAGTIYKGLAIAIIGTIVWISWLICSIILSIQKKNRGEKKWFTPMLIINGTIFSIFALPSLLAGIISSIGDFNTFVAPEIKSFEKYTDIPVLDGYKIINRDISFPKLKLKDVEGQTPETSKVLKEHEQKIGEKVLLKGFPTDHSITYSGSQITLLGIQQEVVFEDYKENYYSVSFADKGSGFLFTDKRFFANDKHTGSDYYVYIYGTVGEYVSDHRTAAGIKIIPEKIYYTLDKNYDDSKK